MSRTKTPEAAQTTRERAMARRIRDTERRTARVAKYTPRVIY